MELFDKDDRYTGIALEFDRQITLAIEPIFREYVQQGGSPRTLAYIANGAIFDVHLNIMLSEEFLQRNRGGESVSESGKEGSIPSGCTSRV